MSNTPEKKPLEESDEHLCTHPEKYWWYCEICKDEFFFCQECSDRSECGHTADEMMDGIDESEEAAKAKLRKV